MRAVGQGRKGKSMFGIGIWNLPGSDLVPTLEWQLNKRATEGLSRVEISEVPEDRVALLQGWLDRTNGEIKGMKVILYPSASGLAAEEDDEFGKEFRAELPCDRIRLTN